MENNQGVKECARRKGVELWQIAQRFNTDEESLAKKLEVQLTMKSLLLLHKVIDEIAKENAAHSDTNTIDG